MRLLHRKPIDTSLRELGLPPQRETRVFYKATKAWLQEHGDNGLNQPSDRDLIQLAKGFGHKYGSQYWPGGSNDDRQGLTWARDSRRIVRRIAAIFLMQARHNRDSVKRRRRQLPHDCTCAGRGVETLTRDVATESPRVVGSRRRSPQDEEFDFSDSTDDGEIETSLNKEYDADRVLNSGVDPTSQCRQRVDPQEGEDPLRDSWTTGSYFPRLPPFQSRLESCNDATPPSLLDTSCILPRDALLLIMSN